MLVKIEEVGDGQHPSERIVKIQTLDGPEQLVVDASSIQEKALEIGYPVGRENGRLLVELPRETFRGVWRVWVEKEIVFTK